jgi:[ribosomal protein S5]-alanine N-acetyltransferase
MNNEISSNEDYIARSETVAIRRVETADLLKIGKFAFTVSITEPLTEAARLNDAFHSSGFWEEDAGAIAIEEVATRRLVGTCQFYRSAPCIHGYELGYIIHEPADRRRGYASQAVRLFSDHLFAEIPAFFRQQLMIEVWNTASWKLAERCGFVREGLLRSSGFGKADPADCFIYSRTRKDWHEELHTTLSMGGAGG